MISSTKENKISTLRLHVDKNPHQFLRTHTIMGLNHKSKRTPFLYGQPLYYFNRGRLINSMWSSDGTGLRGMWSSLFQVMALRLLVANHYLNQCWCITWTLINKSHLNLNTKIHLRLSNEKAPQYPSWHVWWLSCLMTFSLYQKKYLHK